MSITNRLVFDPTDANSIAASANVGAYLRGSDGTLITQTGGKLDVNATISASDLDIRDLVYTSDSVTAHQGGTWDIGTLTSITNDVNIADGGNSITVDASDLDIRDLVAATDSVSAWVKDGSGNAITSTSSALDVNIKSGDIDDSLANTACAVAAKAVSTSAVALVASALTNRKWVYIANEGSKKGYIGPSGVTTATGFPLHAGERAELRAGASVALYAIGATGASSEDYRIMELS
jgi:hypothetical protein